MGIFSIRDDDTGCGTGEDWKRSSKKFGDRLETGE